MAKWMRVSSNMHHNMMKYARINPLTRMTWPCQMHNINKLPWQEQHRVGQCRQPFVLIRFDCCIRDEIRLNTHKFYCKTRTWQCTSDQRVNPWNWMKRTITLAAFLFLQRTQRPRQPSPFLLRAVRGMSGATKQEWKNSTLSLGFIHNHHRV